MLNVGILVVGGGPAGMSAALAAAKAGQTVIVCERDENLGGQLIKQTHKFFGDARQCAGKRGFEISKELQEKLSVYPNIEIWTNTVVHGMFQDGIVTCEHCGEYIGVKAQKIIMATGASEKFALFEGNDLPGVYGAGAVQTLMNVYGIKPAENVVILGAGNIGLITAYQLEQAGVHTLAVVEAMDHIGGYEVHANKLKRMGIPVITKHSIVKAEGNGKVERVQIAALGDNGEFLDETVETYVCDSVCIAVGLQPLANLCWQSGCKMKYISELGGYVPVSTEMMRTTKDAVYVAGDVSGVEEASAAMLEGEIAGLSAVIDLEKENDKLESMRNNCVRELIELRSGPKSEKIRCGLQKLRRQEE